MPARRTWVVVCLVCSTPQRIIVAIVEPVEVVVRITNNDIIGVFICPLYATALTRFDITNVGVIVVVIVKNIVVVKAEVPVVGSNKRLLAAPLIVHTIRTTNVILISFSLVVGVGTEVVIHHRNTANGKGILV